MKAKKCEQTQRVTSDSRQLARPVEVSLNGRRNATLHLVRRPRTSLVRVNFQNWQVGLMSALAASTTFPSVPRFRRGTMRTGKRKIAQCGMNRSMRARNASWFTRSAGLRNSGSGGVFCDPIGRSRAEQIMPCETRAFFNSARCVIGVALLGAMLLCAARAPAQEARQKRGTVKGTVSVVNASQEPSTSEGLLLELKPLAEGAGSLSAITDEAETTNLKRCRTEITCCGSKRKVSSHSRRHST